MKQYEFADIEPLIIEYSKGNKWVHPYIKEWYTPESGSEHDTDVFRVYFKNKKDEKMYVYFKSNYLTQKTNEYFAQEDWEDIPKQGIFNPPYIDTTLVYDCLQMTLVEDMWTPLPPKGAIKNSKEYAKWREQYPSEQFCFTKDGLQVSKFLNLDAKVDFFSLDCGLTTDGTEWFCES